MRFPFIKSGLLAAAISCCGLAWAEAETLRLAITTTTEGSGLMAALNPVFEKKHGIPIKTVVAGSGQVLRIAAAGEVDILLTHAPAEEKSFIASGLGASRTPIMHNDFILLGPGADPAGARAQPTITAAFAAIRDQAATFISRGDNSGTHIKEQAIWQRLQQRPVGQWYVEAGAGMGAVLLLANEKQAYTLTDRGTYLAFRDRINLVIRHEGDALLANPYHAILVNPDRRPHVNHAAARQYLAFLTGPEARRIINGYQRDGQPLFQAGAGKPAAADSPVAAAGAGGFFLNALIASFRLIVNMDKDLFLVVWTSLKVSLIAVLIAALISLPLGVIVALNDFAGKRFLMACLNTLMALPTVVVGLLLYGLLNRQGLLGGLGLLYTPAAMVIGQALLIIPIIWNLCIAAVNSADPRLARTCASLGASHRQRCLIYMSEVRFALVAAVVAGFGRAIGEVGIAMMLGGNIHGYTRTMTTAIALETSKGEFEFALALGFMLLLVAFIVNGLLQEFQIRSR